MEGEWQPLTGTSHTNPTASAALHQGEAYRSGRDQSNTRQRGSAQQGFPPGDLLSFEHHPPVPGQSRARALELTVALTSSQISVWSPGRRVLCCACRSQLPAGA